MYYLATDQGVGCGGNLFNYGGLFASPMYPMNDRNFSDCRWNIAVPTNMKVALRFKNFDMGPKQTCDTNYVEIIETLEGSGMDEVVRTFCGQDIPQTYNGNTNKLSVRFRKTLNFGGTGFLANFIGFADGINFCLFFIYLWVIKYNFFYFQEWSCMTGKINILRLPILLKFTLPTYLYYMYYEQ